MPCCKALPPIEPRWWSPPNVCSPGTWLADWCAAEGIPLVLGHALSRKALHGGKAKHDTSDAQNMAVLRRGGMRPQAYVYPATMRAPRALLRRRMPLAHKRGELLAHVQTTNSPYHLPASGQTIAYKATRDGVAERGADRAVHKRIAVDLSLIDDYEQRLRDFALSSIKAAHHHDANTLSLLRPVPGIGTILSLVRLYDIHDIARFPRGQAFAAYCRLVTCAKESAGKRAGPSGPKSGQAPLTGAFSEAAVFFLREHPEGQTFLGSFEKKPGTGNALTILAQQLARAVYSRCPRKTALTMHSFFNDDRRGVDERDA
jgi:transposase